jgi:hypothetical protein
MDIEFCLRVLPCKVANAKDLAITGSDTYSVAVSKFLDSGTKESLLKLLSSMSERFAVGALGLPAVEYIVHSRLISSFTAPFILHGACKFLMDTKTVHEVCGIEKFDARTRPFPAVNIGHDKQSTTFYLFLSDQIAQAPGAPLCWNLEGLAGSVLSLRHEALQAESKKAEASSDTFDEFLAKLATAGCFRNVATLAEIMFGVCDVGVLTSPCGTRDESVLALHKVHAALFPASTSTSDTEVALVQHDKFGFLADLLDY